MRSRFARSSKRPNSSLRAVRWRFGASTSRSPAQRIRSTPSCGHSLGPDRDGPGLASSGSGRRLETRSRSRARWVRRARARSHYPWLGRRAPASPNEHRRDRRGGPGGCTRGRGEKPQRPGRLRPGGHDGRPRRGRRASTAPARTRLGAPRRFVGGPSTPDAGQCSSGSSGSARRAALGPLRRPGCVFVSAQLVGDRASQQLVVPWNQARRVEAGSTPAVGAPALGVASASPSGARRRAST